MSKPYGQRHQSPAASLLAALAYQLLNLWLPMIPALAGLPALRRLEARPRVHARRP